MKEKFERVYQALCEQLGDLEYKKSQIDKQIGKVRDQMEELNKVSTYKSFQEPAPAPQPVQPEVVDNEQAN